MHQPPLILAKGAALSLLAEGVEPTWAYVRVLAELSVDGYYLTPEERKALLGVVLQHK